MGRGLAWAAMGSVLRCRGWGIEEPMAHNGDQAGRKAVRKDTHQAVRHG